MFYEGEWNSGAAEGEIMMGMHNKFKLVGLFNYGGFNGTIHKFMSNG